MEDVEPSHACLQGLIKVMHQQTLEMARELPMNIADFVFRR